MIEEVFWAEMTKQQCLPPNTARVHPQPTQAAISDISISYKTHSSLNSFQTEMESRLKCRRARALLIVMVT